MTTDQELKWPEDTFENWKSSPKLLVGDFNGVDGGGDDRVADAHEEPGAVEVLHRRRQGGQEPAQEVWEAAEQ